VARRKLLKRSFSEIDRGPLGGAVFDARKRLGMTQAQLAGSIGRDRPWLSDVETGKVTHVPDEDLALLASRLESDIELLKAARDQVNAKFTPSQRPGERLTAFAKLCHSCGYGCDPDARFCANCGTQLPADVGCPRCGHLSAASANYCSCCGSSLH